MAVRSSSLRPFFPNENVVVSATCKPTFNWFLFGQRRLDLKHNLFFLAVPPSTRFLDTKTHSTKAIKDTSTPEKKMESAKYPRMLILSDPHNKKVLCSKMGECAVGCSSRKEKLSSECKIVSDAKHIRRLFNLSVKLGFDGIVSHHVCCNKSIRVNRFPVSQECTFTIKSSKIRSVTGDECRIIKFAKQHNSRIRRLYPTFPNNTTIQSRQKKDGCTKTTKVLYAQLVKYASKRKS